MVGAVVLMPILVCISCNQDCAPWECNMISCTELTAPVLYLARNSSIPPACHSVIGQLPSMRSVEIYKVSSARKF